MTKRTKKFVLAAIFLIFGVLTLLKFFELNNVGYVDGGGIGVYFLGFEISDKVPTEKIIKYALGFLISSIALFTGAFYNIYNAFKKRHMEI